ncbi:MAG: CPBP family intramembrane metalloprotease [Chloroflexi bacterium]|nr:CPBP family intramembrane metalloprotease [Chloroflexota bacterium]MBU1748431.1 CPBP family intramembrane metalloprotease [Chloroflexota bacterium]MBU1878273.1 CPBP family intramembrane metalloprotease [Chloroflexota bacterium]
MDILKRVLLKDGRLHPLWRVLLYMPAYLAVLLVFATFALIVYGIVVSVLGNSGEINHLMAGEITTGAKLAYELASLASIVPLTWLFRYFLDGQSFVSLGFRRRGCLADTVLGVALGFVLMAIIFGVEIAAGWLRVDGLVALPTAVVTVLAYLVIYLIVGFIEELSFRGYIFGNLRDGFGPIVAVILASLIFGVAHAGNPNFGPVALFNIALVGMFFCYAYVATNNLWLPIAYHFSWNYCQGTIFSFPVSGISGEGLFITSLTGAPDWITGGNFGPEAGLLGTIAILASFGVVWAWTRMRARGHA